MCLWNLPSFSDQTHRLTHEQLCQFSVGSFEEAFKVEKYSGAPQWWGVMDRLTYPSIRILFQPACKLLCNPQEMYGFSRQPRKILGFGVNQPTSIED